MRVQRVGGGKQSSTIARYPAVAAPTAPGEAAIKGFFVCCLQRVLPGVYTCSSCCLGRKLLLTTFPNTPRRQREAAAICTNFHLKQRLITTHLYLPCSPLLLWLSRPSLCLGPSVGKIDPKGPPLRDRRSPYVRLRGSTKGY